MICYAVIDTNVLVSALQNTATQDMAAQDPAVQNTAIQDPELVHRLKIDDVLYKNFKNDISFVMGGQVFVFGEHGEPEHASAVSDVCRERV